MTPQRRETNAVTPLKVSAFCLWHFLDNEEEHGGTAEFRRQKQEFGEARVAGMYYVENAYDLHRGPFASIAKY